MRPAAAALVLLAAPGAVASRAHEEILAGLSRNYTNYEVHRGCLAVGNTANQRTSYARRFPIDNMRVCGVTAGCTAFQVYVRPEDTVRTLFVEYKMSCTVLPPEACSAPFGQPGGGEWHTFVSTTHCAPVLRAVPAVAGACEDVDPVCSKPAHPGDFPPGICETSPSTCPVRCGLCKRPRDALLADAAAAHGAEGARGPASRAVGVAVGAALLLALINGVPIVLVTIMKARRAAPQGLRSWGQRWAAARPSSSSAHHPELTLL